MIRLRHLFARVLLGLCLAPIPALGESNPYDTSKGYYSTKGSYSDYNSDDVKARVNGAPSNMQVAANANEVLNAQEEARKKNTANCPNLVDCQVQASRLPGSFADAVATREETYKGGVGNTGLVGLDEKLVEVERVANYGKVGAETAATMIEAKLIKMQGGAYENPNSTLHAVREALKAERDAQNNNAGMFGISANWANRGYRQLVENPDDSTPTGNAKFTTPDAGSASVAASASGTPGEIGNTGNSGGGGSGSGPSTGGGDYAKAGSPGELKGAEGLSANPLEAGRQMAYDILREIGISPVGELRAVGIERGEIKPAGEMTAGELKKGEGLGDAKKLSEPDALLAAKLAGLTVKRAKKGDESDDDGDAAAVGRGAKPKRAAFRSAAPYESEEPPASMMVGMNAAQIKDLKLKWRLFLLTQERARVLTEAGPMISRLRSLGVKTLTQGQSLFQMASRNFRTFERWRKPAVKRAAAVKPTAKPKKARLTAQR